MEQTGARSSGADQLHRRGQFPDVAGRYAGHQIADRRGDLRQQQRPVDFRRDPGGADRGGTVIEHLELVPEFEGFRRAAKAYAGHGHRSHIGQAIRLPEGLPQRGTGQPHLFGRIGGKWRRIKHAAHGAAHFCILYRRGGDPHFHGLALYSGLDRHVVPGRRIYACFPGAHEEAPQAHAAG